MSLFSRMAHRLTRSSKRKAEGLREETSSPLSSRKSPRRSSGTTSESSCPNIIDPIFDSPGTARNYQENPSASSSQGSITTSHSSSSRSAKSSKQRVWTRSGGSKSEKSSQVWEIVSDSPDLLPETGAGPKRTEQPGTSSETGADRTVDSDKDVTSEPDSACTTDNTKMCVNPPHPHDDSLSTLPPRNSARKTFTHRRGNKIQQLTKGNNNEQILPSPAGDASTDKPVSSLHTSSEVQADEPLIGATCAELTWGSDFQSFSQQDFINDSKDLSENEDAHHNERNLRPRKETSHTRSSVKYSIADIQIDSDEDDRPHVNSAKYKTKVKSKHRACTKRRADDVKSVFLGDDCPVMSLSSDSGFHENESSALPDLKSRNPTLLDHDGFANFNFNDGVERMYERKPHLWPKLHDTSKNVFHYTSNLALGRPTFQNRQAVMDTHVMQRVADFEVVDGDQPFNCRVTTIDWHPRVDNLICIGSKHGDLGFYKVQKEDYSLLQEIKSFSGIGPGGYISAFKFHPTDDEKFYTSSLDGKVCLGNIEKDRQRSETVFLNTHSWERWFCSLDAHQTDQLLVAGRNNGWTSLMTRQGEVIWEKRLHSQKISHLEFSPRESYLLCSASLDHTVRLWDLRMMVEKKPMECLFHEKGVNSAYFSLTDGSRLVTTDQMDEIRVYRSPFWHLETCIKHPHRFFQHITPIKAYWHSFTDNILCGRFPDDRHYPDLGSKRTMDMFDAGTGKMHFELKDPLYNGIISLCKFNRTGDKLLCAMGYNFYVWSHHAPLDDEEMSQKQKSMVATSYEGISERGQGRWPGRNRPPGWAPCAEVKRKKSKDTGEIFDLKKKPLAKTKTQESETQRRRDLQSHMKAVIMGLGNSGRKKDDSDKDDKKRKKK